MKTIFWPILKKNKIPTKLIKTKNKQESYYILGYTLNNYLIVINFVSIKLQDLNLVLNLLNDFDNLYKATIIGTLNSDIKIGLSFSLQNSKLTLNNQDEKVKLMFYNINDPKSLKYYYLESLFEQNDNLNNNKIEFEEFIRIINGISELEFYSSIKIKSNLILRNFLNLILFITNILLLNFNLVWKFSKYSLFLRNLRMKFKALRYIAKYYNEFNETYYKFDKKIRKKNINYLNEVYLFFIDWLIGALVFYLFINLKFNIKLINLKLDYYLISNLKNLVVWLTKNPLDFKVNTELSLFLSELFLWIISIWKGIVKIILIKTLTIIKTILYLGLIFGISSLISILNDLFIFLNLHLTFFYLIFSKIYKWEVMILLALFNLFRGKNYNKIKNRIESSTYQPDQLIVGTILFSISTFLFVTISVYYLTFLIFRIISLFIYELFEFIVNILGNFPIYILILRISNPYSIPNGIIFQFKNNDFYINSSKIGIFDIFINYRLLFKHLMKHYVNADIFVKVLTGIPLTPAERFIPKKWT